MTYNFDVHIGSRLVGHADLDIDAVTERMILGKAVYAASPAKTTAVYRDQLATSMGLGDRVVSFALPDRPIVATKHNRPQKITRVRPEVEVPTYLRFHDHSPVHYDIDRVDADLKDWTRRQVVARAKAPHPPRRGYSCERLLDTVVTHEVSAYPALRTARDEATSALRPVYSEIAEALDIDRFTQWTLTHVDSGLRVTVKSIERTRSAQMAALRERLMKTGDLAKLTVTETPGHPRISLKRLELGTGGADDDLYAELMGERAD